MDITSHYERVIRELGETAIRALLWLNAVGAFMVWLSVLSSEPFDYAARAGGYFLTGLIASFVAILATWLLAQIALARGGIPIRSSAALWIMILPPALALVCFVLGYSTAIIASEGGQ